MQEIPNEKEYTKFKVKSIYCELYGRIDVDIIVVEMFVDYIIDMYADI